MNILKLFKWGNDSKKGVKVHKSSDGSHGDHWSAVFGFDDFKGNTGNALSIFVNTHKTAVFKKKITDCFAQYRKDYGNLSFVDIRDTSNQTCTWFPALYSNRTIPVTVGEIVEWEHVDCNEAQIIGKGRDTFGLNFFATDYLENRDVYKKGGTLNISLTGFIYVIHEMKELPKECTPDFVAYMPNQKFFSCGYEYDFIADVISSEQIIVEEEEGYILDMKLINQTDNDSFFNMEAFVNKKNMRLENINIGQKVTGCFWLQGRLL